MLPVLPVLPNRPGVWVGPVVVGSAGLLGVAKPVNPDEGAALLEGPSFCCWACPLPKSAPGVLFPCAWPKLQPDPPPVGLFDPPPNRLLPLPAPAPAPAPAPPPKTELPPDVLVLANGFAAEDAGVLALDPNSPPAGAEVVVFVWPKRLPEVPLVAVLPKEKGLLDFAGSDIVAEEGSEGSEYLGQGTKSAMILR